MSALAPRNRQLASSQGVAIERKVWAACWQPAHTLLDCACGISWDTKLGHPDMPVLTFNSGTALAGMATSSACCLASTTSTWSASTSGCRRVGRCAPSASGTRACRSPTPRRPSRRQRPRSPSSQASSRAGMWLEGPCTSRECIGCRSRRCCFGCSWLDHCLLQSLKNIFLHLRSHHYI